MGNTGHDHFNPDCSANEPEFLARHSNGTNYYRCKNCNYFGVLDYFSKPFDASELLQQH